MKYLICMALVMAAVLPRELGAQETKWTLSDCITYALENNAGLKRQVLLTETATVNLTKSRMEDRKSVV